MKSTTIAGLWTVVNVLKEVAGTSGIPGLQEGVKALAIVLNIIQVCPSHMSLKSVVDCIIAENIAKCR